MKRYESVFNKVIRIKESQLKWLRENFPQYKTDAGKLDIIINSYKSIVDQVNGKIKRTSKSKKAKKKI